MAGPGVPDVRHRGSHAAPAGRQDGGDPSNRWRAVTRSQCGMPLVSSTGSTPRSTPTNSLAQFVSCHSRRVRPAPRASPAPRRTLGCAPAPGPSRGRIGRSRCASNACSIGADTRSSWSKSSTICEYWPAWRSSSSTTRSRWRRNISSRSRASRSPRSPRRRGASSAISSARGSIGRSSSSTSPRRGRQQLGPDDVVRHPVRTPDQRLNRASRGCASRPCGRRPLAQARTRFPALSSSEGSAFMDVGPGGCTRARPPGRPMGRAGAVDALQGGKITAP